MPSEKNSGLKLFTVSPWWYTIRGIPMLLLGGGIALMCLYASDINMIGAKFPWFLAMGIILLIVGILRVIDAYVSDSVPGFLLNMQGGILDIIVGAFILSTIDGEPRMLSHLIAAYMLAQGLFRNIFISVITISNPITNRITGLISIILGILIWFSWVTLDSWFLGFALSIDVSFRGWGLIMLASSMRKLAIADK